jgi:predicted transcriptional regulator of viral defense system
LIAIYDRGQTTFTNSDVEAITGLEATSARSLVRNAEAGGLVTRRKPGLFVLVPPELGEQQSSRGTRI